MKKKELNALAKEITSRQCGKGREAQSHVAEIIGVFADLYFEDSQMHDKLWRYGYFRARKKRMTNNED
jgi:hypothetical protein